MSIKDVLGLDEDQDATVRAHATLNYVAPILGIEWDGSEDACANVALAISRFHQIAQIAERFAKQYEDRDDLRELGALLAELYSAVLYLREDFEKGRRTHIP